MLTAYPIGGQLYKQGFIAIKEKVFHRVLSNTRTKNKIANAVAIHV